jgi:predicted RNA binding protein YcfA (HicA-like mRNA interferase family)
MRKYDKLVFQILRGMSNANIAFTDLVNLLKHLGFDMRIKGSHYVFRKDGVIEKVNLQKEGNKAKPYQVRQVRNIILKYKLGSNV